MTPSLFRWLSVAALAAVPPAYAQIYAGQDESGGVVLSNFPSGAAPTLVISAPPAEVVRSEVPADALAADAASSTAARVSPRDPKIAALIREAAAQNALRPELLHAVIAVESDFNARAVSNKGAMGLMQLMPATAQRFGVTDPFDPRQNVLAGATYLKSLLTLFANDLPLALAAYNAGEAAVIKAGNRIPPFAETRAYVPRVMNYLQHVKFY